MGIPSDAEKYYGGWNWLMYPGCYDTESRNRTTHREAKRNAAEINLRRTISRSVTCKIAIILIT